MEESDFGLPTTPGGDSPRNNAEGSGPESPGSGSISPQSAGPASPDGSYRSGSPVGSNHSGRSRSGSPRSYRSGSPAGSDRSRSGSPAGSDRSQSRSPAGSHRSRSGSSAGSDRSRSGSSVRSNRSRSGSPAGSNRSRSRSHSGSVRSRSGSRSSRGSASRSRSKSGSRSRSRSNSGSRNSRSRSRSGSRSRSHSKSSFRSRSGSRSRSRSHSGSRSRSGSRSCSRSRSRSGSPGSGAGSPGRGADSDVETPSKSKKKDKGSDDDSDKESAVGELIADIFGSSDEDEEFEGFGDVETKPKKDKKKRDAGNNNESRGEAPSTAPAGGDSSDEGLDDDQRGGGGGLVSDFDLMMARKKEEQGRRRKKRKNVDIINDSDDLIMELITQMKEAAEEDRELNQQKQPAIKKLRLLTKVNAQLKKSDLHHAFLDCGILNGITEWLAPLPDRSLPHLTVRESLLKHLLDFPPISSESLKMSGIGKAVMYLYKHPRETRQHKEFAGKLINEWSRPIFNLTSNYKTLTREEREQRDYEQLPKRRRLSLEGANTPRRDLEKILAGKDKNSKPGMPGFIQRARVPQPSKKDYVIRPKWNIDEQPSRSSMKKELNKYEKHQRAFAERKKNKKQQRAVPISVEGKNMAL